MKRLFLVYGPPGAGKSYLAAQLDTKHKFRRLSVDDSYVDFVELRFPEMYFPALRSFIMPHYNLIQQFRGYAAQVLQRDFVAEWQDYLVGRIRELIATTDRDTVVEGYLLEDCKDALSNTLAGAAGVFQIAVDNRTYTWNRKTVLSIDEIAALQVD